MTELTERDRKLLDIFGRPMGYNPKATAIFKAAGLSLPAATVIVNQLIDTEAALAYAPTTVDHLRRLRTQGLERRGARRA